MAKITIDDLFIYTNYATSLTTNDVIEVSTYDSETASYKSNTVTLDVIKKTFTDRYLTLSHNILDVFFKPCDISSGDNTSDWPLFVESPTQPNWIFSGKDMSSEQLWTRFLGLIDKKYITVDIISTDSDYTNTKYWTEYTQYGFTSRFILSPNTGHIAAPILNSSYIRNLITSSISLNLGNIGTSLLKSHKHYIKTITKDDSTGSEYPVSLVTKLTGAKKFDTLESGDTDVVIPKTTYMIPYIKCGTSVTPSSQSVNKSYIQNMINMMNTLPIGSIISITKAMYSILDGTPNNITLSPNSGSWKLFAVSNETIMDKFYIKGFDDSGTFGAFSNPYETGLINSPLFTHLDHYHGYAFRADDGSIWKCQNAWYGSSDYHNYLSYCGVPLPRRSGRQIASVVSGLFGTTDMLPFNEWSKENYTPASFNLVFLVKTT